MTKILIVLRLRDLSGVKAPSKIGKILANTQFSLMTLIELLQGLGEILKLI